MESRAQDASRGQAIPWNTVMVKQRGGEVAGGVLNQTEKKKKKTEKVANMQVSIRCCVETHTTGKVLLPYLFMQMLGILAKIYGSHIHCRTGGSKHNSRTGQSLGMYCHKGCELSRGFSVFVFLLCQDDAFIFSVFCMSNA